MVIIRCNKKKKEECKMTNKEARILCLIENQKSCKDICHSLNMKRIEFYEHIMLLQNKGINFKRKYFANGNIIYQVLHTPQEIQENILTNNNKIILEENQKQLKTLILSDLHIGSTLERPDLISRAFRYCKVNNIHIIFCCGDIIDGPPSKYTDQKIKGIDKQMEYMIETIPIYEDILVFAVGGNHDLHALKKSGQSLTTLFNNYRHDIIMNDYGNTNIEIANDSIQLFHKTRNPRPTENKEALILHGHYHKYKTKQSENGIVNVIVPTLSNILEELPSVIEATLSLKNDYINDITLKQICFGQSDYILGETQFNNIIEKRNINVNSPKKLIK